MDIGLSEIIKATGGVLTGVGAEGADIRIKGISTDSREELESKLFVAIDGERFDGHNYIEQAFEKSAACVLSEKEVKSTGPVIRVLSTRTALLELAGYYRSLFTLPVVAVTGSTGKTTTKDMAYSVLSTKFKTLHNECNFNNEIGLPQTVFKLERDHGCAVFEMGMNHFGELKRLSKAARPDVCAITNIGYSHIENLGSKEGILKAKSEVFEYMKEGGLAILNGDDEMLRGLNPKRVIWFGLERNNDIRAENIRSLGEAGISGMRAVISFGGVSFEVDIKAPGAHMVYNALCAAAIGFGLGLDAEHIKRGIESSPPVAMRMNVEHTAFGLTIINDVYNANPASAKAAIDVLATSETPTACIIGDMLELGTYAIGLHNEIGRYLVEKGIDKIICVGPLAKHVYDAANECGLLSAKAYYYADQDALISDLENVIDTRDTVLCKASRAMALEKTVERLRKLGNR